jgi:hypothetical protein
MRIALAVLLLQVILASGAFANYGSYEREKQEFRQENEGGGAAVYPYGGGFVVPQNENPDPAYDSTVDEDMLFDSYHNQN